MPESAWYSRTAKTRSWLIVFEGRTTWDNNSVVSAGQACKTHGYQFLRRNLVQLQVPRQSVHDDLQLASLGRSHQLCSLQRPFAECLFGAEDALSGPAKHDLELVTLGHVERGSRNQAREHGLAQSQVLLSIEKLGGARIHELLQKRTRCGRQAESTARVEGGSESARAAEARAAEEGRGTLKIVLTSCEALLYLQ